MDPGVPSPDVFDRDFLTGIGWGAHLCHFHDDGAELLDVVVPFLASGLENHERCAWAVADPLTVDAALCALREAVPDLDRHLERGSVDVRRHEAWYLPGGSFDAHELTGRWQGVLADALAAGYRGVRATGSTSWLTKSQWPRFVEYERRLDAALAGHPMKVLCSYSLPKCGAVELLEVARTHQQAIARRDGTWEVVATVRVRSGETPPSTEGGEAETVVPEEEWRRRERANILAAMRASKGRIYGRGGAAERLALKPSTLQSRIRAFGIKPGEADQDN